MKKQKKMKKIETEETKVVKKFFIVLILVVVCVAGLYFFTRAFVSKDLFNEKSNDTKEEVEFNYDKTILGSAFNRPYFEYYVVIYKSSDEQANYLSAIISDYQQGPTAIKLYYADLDDHMNKSYYDKENVNSKATKASELKVGDYTLIKIENGEITEFIEGYENIVKKLEV